MHHHRQRSPAGADRTLTAVFERVENNSVSSSVHIDSIRIETIGGTLSPAGGATRAQAATILMRFCQEIAHGAYTLTVVSAMDVMCEPNGILSLADGSFLVTDTYNKVIWRVAGDSNAVYIGTSTVYAGSGQAGLVNGSAAQAAFSAPRAWRWGTTARYTSRIPPTARCGRSAAAWCLR